LVGDTEFQICSRNVRLLAPLARIALWSRCLPLSLADEKRFCSFVRPGQRRAILARIDPPTSSSLAA